MGINSIVLIHGDALPQIDENSTSFVAELSQAIHHMDRLDKAHVGAGNAAKAAQVITAAHSSTDYFVRVHGNTAHHVTWQDAQEDDLQAMAEFLRSKGYTVSRPGGSSG